METRGARVWTYFLQAYYLMTPAFYLLDRFTGINLRASYFDGQPTLNIAYYCLAFGCGIVCLFFRRASIFIGLGESILNILLLITGFALHYTGMIEGFMNDKPDAEIQAHANALQSTGNFLLSAFVLCVSFYHNPFIRSQMKAEQDELNR